MPEGSIPPDAAAQALVDVYREAERRVARMVRLALSRGLDPDRVGTESQQRGDASAAYWKRQHAMIRQQLRLLESTAPLRARAAVEIAYRAGATAADVLTIGVAAGAGTFGGIHADAVTAIARNLAEPLAASARTAGVSVADVFARAQALEGALSPSQLVPGVDFLGRRIPDALREATLREVGIGIASGASRRDVTRMLAKRLIDDGTADAVTGLVDAAGRRWSLARYAEMATRTTTREAVVRGTVNRLRELPGAGTDLVTVSSHPHAADECTPYDGKTFSLDGTTPGYDVLDEMPPYHPNCRHVLMPATAGFDEYVRALGLDPEPGASPPAPTSPLAADAAAARQRGPMSDGRATALGRDVAGEVDRRALTRMEAIGNEGAAVERDLQDVGREITTIIEQGAAGDETAIGRLAAPRARRDALEARRRELHEALANVNRDATLEVLGELRPGYGTGTIAGIAGDAGASDLIASAARYLPREWIDASNGAGRIEAVLDTTGRGLHQPLPGGHSRITVKNDPFNALHELTHRLQRAVPGIDRAELDFYLRRCTDAGGNLEPRRRLRDLVPHSSYRDDEVARPDGFRNPYTGKDYGRGAHEAVPREVLTMGLEELFRNGRTIGDDDFRHFLLGLLAGHP